MGQSNVVLRATTELFFFKALVKYVRNGVQTSEGTGPLYLTSALVSSGGELSVKRPDHPLNSRGRSTWTVPIRQEAAWTQWRAEKSASVSKRKPRLSDLATSGSTRLTIYYGKPQLYVKRFIIFIIYIIIIIIYCWKALNWCLKDVKLNSLCWRPQSLTTSFVHVLFVLVAYTLEFTIGHAFSHVQNCLAATRFAAEERPVSMFQFSQPLYIEVNMLPTLF